MRKLDRVLPDALGREEVLRGARAYRALHSWPEIVGEALAARSWPDKYERGTVWVAVQGSAWAQELRMVKERILDGLGRVSGERSLFKDVRFGVRPLPNPDLFARFPDADEALPPVDREPYADLTIREIVARRERLRDNED